eukprot:CAMPEP_0172405110 /NCGR_PEP_ID=MMETSP1061-20121228/65827_1 /TAXON_ID=37318 /ORGANISM="Pseudo-nitzschia pungens, Strain cf. pungens" /LENGTH=1648 /DNA_ID=CAMNT_0013140189 /DNA_START=62 /DNA_END=5008 /DNA_ORIENTATION=+
MIPTQEEKLRDSDGSLLQAQHHEDPNQLISDQIGKNKLVWKGKQPPLTKSRKGDLKRSSTSTSHESSKTNKSTSSGESSLRSFVHSNASLSSSSSPPSISSFHQNIKNETDCYQEWNDDSDLRVVEETSLLSPKTIDWCATNCSKGKVRVAIENFEEIIEVIRQKSIVSEARSSSPKITDVGMASAFSGFAATSIGRPADKPTRYSMGDEDFPQDVPKSPSLDALNDGTDVEEKQDGFEVRYTFLNQERREAELMAAVTPVPLQSAGIRSSNKPRHARQQSCGMSVSDSSDASSASFISAIDEHLASRRNNNMSPRVKQFNLASDSIEVMQTTNDQNGERDALILIPQEISINNNECDEDAKMIDLNRFISPSTINRVRRNPSDTALSFHAPPPTKKSVPEVLKEETVEEEELTFIEDIEDEQEAFEVGESGNVIEVLEESEKHQEDSPEQEVVDKPYKLVRVDESNGIEALRQPHRASFGAQKFLRLMIPRKRKNVPQATLATSKTQNPIRILGDDGDNGAIELHRSSTTSSTAKNVIKRSSFSFDESEEDDIVRRTSLVQSPHTSTVPVESQRLLRVDSNFEILPPAIEKGNKTCIGTSIFQTKNATAKAANNGNNICSKKGSEECASTDVAAALMETPDPMLTSTREKMMVEINLATPKAGTTALPSKSLQEVQSVNESHSKCGEDTVGKNTFTSIPTASSVQPNDQLHHTNSPQESNVKSVPVESNKELAWERQEKLPQQNNTTSVPKLPTPKDDTLAYVQESDEADQKGLAESADEISFNKLPRRVKIQVLSPNGNGKSIKNIEVTPSVSSSLVGLHEAIKPIPEDSDPVKSKKYTTMVVKPSPKSYVVSKEQKAVTTDIADCNTKHIVHVNVLGVAGIVVDHKLYNNFTGNKLPHVPPDQIRAVVGISEPGHSVDSMSAFSSPLVHAPNTKLGYGGRIQKATQLKSRRHIAVWASNHRGQTPGSMVESNVLDTRKADSNDPKSKYLSQFLNLNVALTPSGSEVNHLAFVIGAARLEITDKMMRGRQTLTFDLPVQPIVHDSSSSRNNVIKLRITGGRGIPQMVCASKSDREKDVSQRDISNLTSGYKIDPSGDSMIRVQVRVDEINLSVNQRKGSFANQTAATADTADCSFDHSILPPTTAACRAFDAFISVDPKDREKSKALGEDLYSKPIEFPSEFACKEKLLESKCEETISPGCRVFGRKVSIPSCSTESRMAVAKRIDDRIENIAERVIDTSCAALSTDDDLSIDRNDTSSTMESHTEQVGMAITVNNDESVNPQKLLEEMKEVLGPVPTIKELKLLAKEIALTSGEYLFHRGSQKIVNKFDDEDDSVGSATLIAFEMGQLRMRTMDGTDVWNRKRDDENETSSSEGSEESEHSTSESDDKTSKNEFDVDDDESETLCSFNAATLSDGGCEGDDEVSTLKDRAGLMDRATDKRQECNKVDDKPSLPSVVENIAEVLSTQPCGFFGTSEPSETGVPNGVWNTDSFERGVPQSIDQTDMLSVGELTAITLEKIELSDQHRKILMSRFGLPTDIFSRGTTTTNSRSDDGDSQKQQHGVSGKGTNVIKQPGSENYFAEYEDGVSGVTSIYDTTKISGKPIGAKDSSPRSEGQDVKPATEESATVESADASQRIQGGGDVESV